MVEIKESSREFSKVEIYRMTLDNDIASCKDLEDGTEIEVDGYITYDDVKADGKTEEVFAILSTGGEVFACTSKTFARNVRDIADIFDGEKFTIIKRSGTTKAGKPFIMASLKH